MKKNYDPEMEGFFEGLKKLMVEASETGATNALINFERTKAQTYPLDKVWKYNQVAKRLGVAFSTIKRMVAEGRLTPVADGMGISEKEVLRYINSTKQ